MLVYGSYYDLHIYDFVNDIPEKKKALVNAFQPDTTTVTETVGAVEGVKVRVFDTPGQYFNQNILNFVKKLTRKILC